MPLGFLRASGNRVTARGKRLRNTVTKLASSLLVLALALPLGIGAADVEVSLDVGDTVLVVEGNTSPLADVTILSNGSTIGTAVADNSGFFSQTFSAQDSGLRNIKVFARDTDGVLTDTISKNLNVVDHATTTLSVFLPPSISLSKVSLREGETLNISGQSTPGAKLIVRIDNNLNKQTTVASNGAWEVTVNTGGFFIGTHSLFALAQLSGGNQSEPTAKRLFTVIARSGQPPAEPDFIPPPVIVFPPSGYETSNSSLTVRGTSLPNAAIELYNGDDIIGSTFANHRGEWSIQLNLSSRSYTLRARACISDNCSQLSAAVTFKYLGDAKPVDFEFYLAQYRYFNVFVDSPIRLDVFTRGGQKPFQFIVDWGDDDLHVSTVEHNRPLKLDHSYQSIGHYNGVVTLQDKQGATLSKYFSVDVKPAPSGIASQLLAIIGAVWTYLITATGTTPLLLKTGALFVLSAFRYVEEPDLKL